MKTYASYGEFRYGRYTDLLTGKNLLLGCIGIALFLGQAFYLSHETNTIYCETKDLSTRICYPSIRVEEGIPFKSDTEEWILENGVKARLVSSNHDYTLDKLDFAFWLSVPFVLAALIGFIRDRISSIES